MQCSKIGLLFDEPVGAGKQCWRHPETERPCGLEVDEEIEFRRLLDRQITRPRPLQNSVHVDCGSAKQVRVARTITHKAPFLHKFLEKIHRRQAALVRELYDPLPLTEQN